MGKSIPSLTVAPIGFKRLLSCCSNQRSDLCNFIKKRIYGHLDIDDIPYNEFINIYMKRQYLFESNGLGGPLLAEKDTIHYNNIKMYIRSLQNWIFQQKALNYYKQVIRK